VKEERHNKQQEDVVVNNLVLNWSYWKGAGAEGMAEEFGGEKGKRWQLI